MSALSRIGWDYSVKSSFRPLDFRSCAQANVRDAKKVRCPRETAVYVCVCAQDVDMLYVVRCGVLYVVRACLVPRTRARLG